MTAEEQITRLEEQLTQVLEQLRLKDEQLQVAQAQLRVAQARIEELEKQKTPPPPFVKANVVKPQAADRSDRACGVSRLVQPLRRVAGGPHRCERTGGGTGTLRGEGRELDNLSAHGDATAGATDTSVSGEPAWPQD